MSAVSSYRLAALAWAGLSLSAHASAEHPVAPPQPMIVASDNPTNWLGANNRTLDGVGRITISETGGSYICSGSLIGGGQYLLTAAHCLTDEDSGALTANSTAIRFKIGSAGAVTVTGTDYFVNPNWKGFNQSAGDGSDLAIIKLSSAVTSIASYSLSNGSDLGKTFMMAGYGVTGNGNTGATGGAPQALHYGYNVNDTTDADLQNALFGSTSYATMFGDTYVYDFDNGNAKQNALTRLYGAAGVSFTSDLGLGANESMIGGGDSGGGDFVQDASGHWILSAVHSYGWDLCTDIAHGGYDDSLGNCVVRPNNAKGSSFGSLGGSTAVYTQLAWINAVTAVPEPETFALMWAGLAAVGWASRRRTRHAA